MALFTRMLSTWPSGSGSLDGYAPNGAGETQYSTEVWGVNIGTINYGTPSATRAYCAANSVCQAQYELGPGGNEVELTGFIGLGIASAENLLGVNIRYVDDSNRWTLVFDKFRAEIAIYEVVGPTPTVTKRSSTADAGLTGTTQYLCSAFGTTITITDVTRTKTATYSSSLHQSATKASLRGVHTGTITSYGYWADITAQITLAPTIYVAHDAGGGLAEIVDGETDPIDFGNIIYGGTPPEETIEVTNNGVGTLTISSVTLPAGYDFAASNQIPGGGTTISEGATKDLVVKLLTASVGTKSGDIVIASDATDVPSFNFAITGIVDPDPEIDITLNGDPILDNGDPTDFGTILLGDPDEVKTFVVANNGVGTLTIGTVTFPDHFEAGPSNQVPAEGTTIAQGATKNLVVAFPADSVGTFTESVTITCDDPDDEEAVFFVNLTGVVQNLPSSSECALAGALPMSYTGSTGPVVNTQVNTATSTTLVAAVSGKRPVCLWARLQSSGTGTIQFRALGGSVVSPAWDITATTPLILPFNPFGVHAAVPVGSGLELVLTGGITVVGVVSLQSTV